MSVNLALHRLLFWKMPCHKALKTVMISLLVVLSCSFVIMDKNADASSSSYLTSLNDDHDKWQTLQIQDLQDVSAASSLILPPPADFEFSYSFGILGESNNTLSSAHGVYLKESTATRPINITFTLSTAQMQRIWMAAKETGFFQISNNFTETCDTSGNCVLVAPEHYYVLKITANNTTKTVIAREAYAFQHDEEYQKFKSLVDQVERITTISQNETVPSDHSEPKRGYL